MRTLVIAIMLVSCMTAGITCYVITTKSNSEAALPAELDAAKLLRDNQILEKELAIQKEILKMQIEREEEIKAQLEADKARKHQLELEQTRLDEQKRIASRQTSAIREQREYDLEQARWHAARKQSQEDARRIQLDSELREHHRLNMILLREQRELEHRRLHTNIINAHQTAIHIEQRRKEEALRREQANVEQVRRDLLRKQAEEARRTQDAEFRLREEAKRAHEAEQRLREETRRAHEAEQRLREEDKRRKERQNFRQERQNERQQQAQAEEDARKAKQQAQAEEDARKAKQQAQAEEDARKAQQQALAVESKLTP